MKICWHCGAGLPENVYQLPFETAAQRRLFGTLYARISEVVPYGRLGKSRAAIQVQISRVRKVLQECGAPFIIDVEYGEGYILTEHIDET